MDLDSPASSSISSNFRMSASHDARKSAGLSLADIARQIGRDRIHALNLIKRFDLPSFTGNHFPPSYLPFLRNLVFLRLAQVSEERLLELWGIERKLMTLLHADTLGSPTWMLDGHAGKGGDSRRLFLGRHDLGTDLFAQSLQPGLDFSSPDAELFAARDMGEDVPRVLRAYLDLLAPLRRSIADQAPILQAAARWAGPSPRDG